MLVYGALISPFVRKVCLVAAQGEAELPRIYEYLESVCPIDGWLVGDAFGLADIAVASMLRTMVYVDLFPPPGRYPAIAAWYARVCERPAWRQVAAQEDGFRVPLS